jgi:hypothetical protein
MAYSIEQTVMARTFRFMVTHFHFSEGCVGSHEYIDSVNDLVNTCPVEVGKPIKNLRQVTIWYRNLKRAKWYFNEQADISCVVAAYNKAVDGRL